MILKTTQFCFATSSLDSASTRTSQSVQTAKAPTPGSSHGEPRVPRSTSGKALLERRWIAKTQECIGSIDRSDVSSTIKASWATSRQTTVLLIRAGTSMTNTSGNKCQLQCSTRCLHPLESATSCHPPRQTSMKRRRCLKVFFATRSVQFDPMITSSRHSGTHSCHTSFQLQSSTTRWNEWEEVDSHRRNSRWASKTTSQRVIHSKLSRFSSVTSTQTACSNRSTAIKQARISSSLGVTR